MLLGQIRQDPTVDSTHRHTLEHSTTGVQIEFYSAENFYLHSISGEGNCCEPSEPLNWMEADRPALYVVCRAVDRHYCRTGSAVSTNHCPTVRLGQAVELLGKA